MKSLCENTNPTTYYVQWEGARKAHKPVWLPSSLQLQRIALVKILRRVRPRSPSKNGGY